MEQSREIHINQAQENNSDVALLSLPCKGSDTKMYKSKVSGNMLSISIGLKIIFKQLFFLYIKKD